MPIEQRGENLEHMKKKISVIMPVFNGMPYFINALESVRSQSLKELEILVVDAGSTDGTYEYIEKCRKDDKRIRCILSDKKSMGHQYNLGLQDAGGEYIGFCESDDYMEADAMEYLYGIAEKNNKPDCIKSVFSFFADKNMKIELDYSVLPRNRLDLYNQGITIDDLPELFARDANMWNGIYKKDFIEKNNILLNETSGAAFQDMGYVLQTHMLSRDTVYGSKRVYRYRKDNEGSSTYKAATGKFVLDEMIYILDFLNEHNECKQKYLFGVFNRAFGLFASHYGKNLYYGTAEKYEDSIERTQHYLRTYYEELPFVQKFGIPGWGLLNTFQNSINDFKTVAMNNYRNRIENFYRFWNYVRQKQEVVIFGCGERGQGIAACLMKNKYSGKMIFCDNQIQSDMQVLGIDAYSVEHAVQKYAKALFIISNAAYFPPMQKQLKALGIREEQIICAPVITPAVALELDFAKDLDRKNSGCMIKKLKDYVLQ